MLIGKQEKRYSRSDLIYASKSAIDSLPCNIHHCNNMSLFGP